MPYLLRTKEDERVCSAKPYLDVSLALLKQRSTSNAGADASSNETTNGISSSSSSSNSSSSSHDCSDNRSAPPHNTDRKSPPSFELIASCGPSVERQVQLECATLPAGTYTLVPTSTGCRFNQVGW